MEETTEIWKEIEGWEGLYSVSSFGRLKRHDAYNNCPILKSGLQFRPERIKIINHGDKNKYLITSFWNNQFRKSYSVHGLVARAFIQNPENKPTVNHKNGIKYDNRVENLEWATQKEQIAHAKKMGLKKTIHCGENHVCSTITVKEALAIRIIGRSRICEQKEIAALYGITKGMVSQIVTGANWNRAINEFLSKKTA